MKTIRYRSLFPIYLLLLSGLVMIAYYGSRAVTVFSENVTVSYKENIIIDAGHGGIDGGATSCTGALESQLNLEIAIKLRDIMNLLGIHTLMIRETDCSVYTKGETIAQKKVSDLKERVRIVNGAENPVLISIHQNYFTDARYSGAQIFYAPTQGSRELATQLQSAFIKTLNPNSNRKSKKADGVYLMQHINCPGILVECGFLSNPQEEYLLRDTSYQQKICSVIACTLSLWLFAT